VNSFDYHAPTSLQETFDFLQTYGEDAHLMAGGTALILLLQQGLLQPGHVVGLQRVADLQGIRRLDDGGLQIRAMATHRQAEKSADVQAYCPALAENFSHVATIRIRNQGTVGGNLAHADPAQDPPPMLIALNGQAVIASRAGERRMPLDEFFVDFFETALQPGEVLVSIDLPPLASGTRVTYKKFLPRTQDDYATVSVAAALRMGADNTCEDVRVALGAAATTPIHARNGENALRGQRLDTQKIKDAAALVRDEVDPLDDLRGSAAYKREMARVWTQRALQELLDASA
jgi:aerobic carbon-monoxide dehydrogenase medium subunit